MKVIKANRIYPEYIKRLLDFCFALCAIVFFSPLLVLISFLSIILLGGNPFFTQMRPGKNEKVFRLIKFRSMSNATDASGNLLSDEKRLNTSYGKFLRSTSLDELPELFNILIGDMSFIGPRPLLVKYLPYYTETEKHRHDVRPGLTGYAQTHGRDITTWEERFNLDLRYVNNISFLLDIRIIIDTIRTVINTSNVQLNSLADLDVYRCENKKD